MKIKQLQNAQDDSKQNTIEQNSNKSTEELIETKNEALTCFLRPENQTYFMKFAENELLWIPERYFRRKASCDLSKVSLFVFRSNVELHEKLYGEQPRYLEEEGIYVKDKLKVPSWCLNLLERRLLQDERYILLNSFYSKIKTRKIITQSEKIKTGHSLR